MTDKPLKMLIGMPSPDSRGGPINCEPPFVAALRDLGISVDEETYVYGDGGSTASTFARVRRVADAARRLRARTRDNEYDLSHLNTSFDERSVLRDLTVLAAIKGNAPVFLKMHGSSASFLRTKSRAWRALQTRLFYRVDAIGVLSNEERENFAAAGCPAEKLYVVKNALGSETAFSRDDDFRAGQGIDANIPLLLFSSRMIATKGLADVIDACGILRDRGRAFSLFCLGDGPERSNAAKQALNMGLTQHIRFTGYVSEAEASRFHADTDLLLFPTFHDEGLPVVLLKTLAAGQPIITTRIRAAADYLREPENCLWVNPRDPVGLAHRIEEMLDNRDIGKRMSENNRKLAADFEPENVAREYIDMYRRIAFKPRSKS